MSLSISGFSLSSTWNTMGILFRWFGGGGVSVIRLGTIGNLVERHMFFCCYSLIPYTWVGYSILGKHS